MSAAARSLPAARPWRTALAAGLVACALGACGNGAPAEPGPFQGVRFECAAECGSYKTVAPGQTPPPCCYRPMVELGASQD